MFRTNQRANPTPLPYDSVEGLTMFRLLHWIQKRHEHGQLSNEAEACQVERRIQQARLAQARLDELQRTMDPLIAAHVYNYRFCPLLARLPEDNDAVALQCPKMTCFSPSSRIGRSIH